MQNCKQKLTTLTKLFLFMIALLMFINDPVMAANDVDQQNTIVIPAEPDLGELVDNQIPGWQTSHAVRGKIRVVDSISYNGDYSVHIADDDGLAYGLESSFVPVVAGESYTASAMTYMESGTSRPVIFIRFYNENEELVASRPIGAGELGEWAPIAVTEQAPQDAVYATILLFSDSIGLRSLYFDDAEIRHADGEQIPFENPGFEQMISGGGQENAIVISTEADLRDLVDNQIPSWHTTHAAQGKISVVDSISYTGDYSVHIADDDGLAYGLESQLVPIVGGQIYTASAMTYMESGTSRPVIFIRFFDENEELVGSRPIGAGELGEWAPISVTERAPQDAVYAAALLFSDSIGIRSLYFDDVEIRDAHGDIIPFSNPGFEDTYSAATEPLIEYVEKSTGARLPVTTSEPSDYEGIQIYIGRSHADDAARHQAQLETLNEHGFIIDSAEDRITIIGTTPRATEYGVYEFLERYVGVRWLMPGATGEHVPTYDTLTIPYELIQDQPATISRHFFGLDGNVLQDWYRHNRFHHNIQFHHNLSTLFDPEVFADHPEYYAGGEVPTHPYSWQVCFNDETADAAIQRIIEYFDMNPQASSYSLGINDGQSFCEGPGHPDYPTELNSVGRQNRSDLYYRWVNRIAEGVTAVHPDKYFGLLAYRQMYDPPKNEDGTPYQLHPNVVPYITDDRMTWKDSEIGAIGIQHTINWMQSAQNLGFYEYLYGTQYNLPRIYNEQMAENYQFADEQGVIGHVAEIYPNWGEGPKPWVSAKLQWNPDQDVHALLGEWYVSAVGEEAAPYLQQYYDKWEQIWTDRILESEWYLRWARGVLRNNYLPFTDQSYLEEVTKEDIAEFRHLIERVVALSHTPAQKIRAEILMKMFEFYELNFRRAKINVNPYET